MASGSEGIIGKDTIEERIRIAQANYKTAEEIDDRWNWYVITIPIVAIALSLQMEIPNNIVSLACHIFSLLTLCIAGIIGITSQRYKSSMLIASAKRHMHLAQLCSDNAAVNNERLLNALSEAIADKEKKIKSMKFSQCIHYCMIGIGLTLMVLQHILSIIFVRLCPFLICGQVN